tara:strand:- start:1626 stop:1991 length:366 start_codon:yes stop_codon:yes gene_type:complete
MSVVRLGESAVSALLQGNTPEPTTCILKFYSNSCHYCHALKDYYEDIANEYPEVPFFAFNIQDGPHFEAQLGFRGVPTIIKVITGGKKAEIQIIDEPELPNEHTYYTTEYIKNFIEEGEQL